MLVHKMGILTREEINRLASATGNIKTRIPMRCHNHTRAELRWKANSLDR